MVTVYFDLYSPQGQATNSITSKEKVSILPKIQLPWVDPLGEEIKSHCPSQASRSAGGP